MVFGFFRRSRCIPLRQHGAMGWRWWEDASALAPNAADGAGQGSRHGETIPIPDFCVVGPTHKAFLSAIGSSIF